ncbi:MAG: hypothetical protein AAF729_07825 [Pseudomonadota bacterium]
MRNEIAGGDVLEDGDRKLVLKLKRRLNGSLEVLACEVLASSLTNRTVFHRSMDIFDVLNDRLSQAITRQLDDVGEARQIIALPELLVELPGLTLASAHVVVSKLVDGAQNIIFRFMQFLGSLDAALKPQIGVGGNSASYAEKLATDVLGDIALPLLNICQQTSAAKDAGQEDLKRAHDFLAKRAHEIEFQIELVKRFVAQSEPVLQPRFVEENQTVVPLLRGRRFDPYET